MITTLIDEIYIDPTKVPYLGNNLRINEFKTSNSALLISIILDMITSCTVQEPDPEYATTEFICNFIEVHGRKIKEEILNSLELAFCFKNKIENKDLSYEQKLVRLGVSEFGSNQDLSILFNAYRKKLNAND